MTETLAVVFTIVAFTAAVIGLVLIGRRMAERRRIALEGVARQSGWSFAPERVTPGELGVVGAFPLFTHGRSARAYNVMRGSDGPVALTVFDYQYTVGSGKHRHTVTQTVVHLRSPRLALPAFVLGPENVLHKVGGLFGYHDIDFDSSPEFSKRYLLRGKESEGRVRDLFSPSMRVYFEQRSPAHVEGDGQEIVVYHERRVVKPEDLRTFVEDARAIARQFSA